MLEERVRGLEEELLGLSERLSKVEAAVPAVEPGKRQAPAPVYAPPARSMPAPVSRQAATPTAAPRPAPSSAPAPRPTRAVRDLPDFEDLLGGRVLAWLGGTAVLVGLAFLMALAISNGWIGEGARTLMAGAAATLLIGVGIWLHERRGRTDAALAALSSGIAAMFAVAAIASQVYELIPAGAALVIAGATGSLATWLAVRWEAQGIAALGILGAMLAPLLAGGEIEGFSLLVLFVAGAAAVAVLVHQGWRWLSVGTICLVLPQWGAFLFDHHESTVQVLAVLTAFGLLGALAAVGHELRERPDKLAASSAFLLVLNAFAVGCAGWLALGAAAGHDTATLFLWGLAAVHLAAGLVAGQRRSLPPDLAVLMLTTATVLGNVAFAATVDGPARTFGWAATAVGFALLVRRHHEPGHQGTMASIGLGGHLALAMVQVLTSDASPELIGPGDAASFGSVGALVGLAAACFASGRLADEEHGALRTALDVAGLAAVAYLTAITLDGVGLVLAFAVEAGVLAVLARREDDPVAAAGAAANLGLALALGLGLAPPTALGIGLADPLAASAALLAVCAAAGLMARIEVPAGGRPWMIGGVAVVLMYLASVLLVTPFQPDGAAAQATVVELPVRQQGQVLLSGLWALCGVAGIVVGLTRDVRPLRLAALGLLLTAVAKVFMFDLATLTSLYRVASFVGLGVLLLAAAFVWQRIRPRALPDMREAPQGIR